MHRLTAVVATAVALLLALPVLAVAAAWLDVASSLATLSHQLTTVLPVYAGTSLLLAVGVGIGVACLGAATAVAVTLFEFRAGAWLDLGFAVAAWPCRPTWRLTPTPTASAVQRRAANHACATPSACKGACGARCAACRGRWCCSRGHALPLCLPARPHRLGRARGALYMEAARLLGASLWRRSAARGFAPGTPGAGSRCALALMETLADYGVGSYFGLSTLTTGVYKAWLVNGDRQAAAQLASLLLVVVLVCMALERKAQARMRFASTRASAAKESLRVPLRGGLGRAGAVLVPAAHRVGLCAAAAVVGLAGAARMAVRRAAPGAPRLGVDLEQLQAGHLGGAAHGGAGGGFGRGAAPDPLARPALGGPRGGPLAGPGLCGAGRRHRRGLAVALGVAANRVAGCHAPVFTGTVLGLILAYCVRFGGVALQSVEAGYARIPASLDDSARLLGAGPQRLLARVHLPLLSRAALAAALLVFVDVMKELPATLLLRPFNNDTLAVMAYQLARDERLGEAALPAVAIALGGFGPGGLAVAGHAPALSPFIRSQATTSVALWQLQWVQAMAKRWVLTLQIL
jgi:iron(III) transport system permease protein